MPAAVPLVEIGILLVALLAIALAQQINNIMEAVSQIVRAIPLIGGKIADGIEYVAQAIAHVLGKAEAGVDAAIGASWHLLARLTDMLWHQITGTALGYLHTAELLARIAYAHSGLRTIVHAATAALHGIEHGVKDLQREWRGIEHKVKQLERDLTKGIGHDLHIGLRDLRKNVKVLDHQVTVAIPKAIDYAEGQTTRLQDFIKAIPGTGYLDWAGALVLAGLGTLGLDWIKCKEAKNGFSRRGCQWWKDLDTITSLITDIVIINGVCEVLPILDAAVSEFATPLVISLTDAGAGICTSDSAGPALATGPLPILPPVYYTGNLDLA